MTQLNVKGPQADARARRIAAAEAREADLRAQGQVAAADALRDARLARRGREESGRARAKNEKDKLPVLVQTVNELEVQKAELQKLLTPGVDSMAIDIQTVDLVLVFTKRQQADNERDQKIVEDNKDADAVRKANNRIYQKTATARKTAISKKNKALEALKAELEVEVQELSARVVALPGSAVSHS